MSTHLHENGAFFTDDGEFVHKNGLPLQLFGKTGDNKTLTVCEGLSFRQGMGQDMLPEHVFPEHFRQRGEAVRGADVAQVLSPGKGMAEEASGQGKGAETGKGLLRGRKVFFPAWESPVMLLMQAAHEKMRCGRKRRKSPVPAGIFAAGRTIFPRSCRNMCF